MIALLGAFAEEIEGLRRQMVIEEVVSGAACRIHRGRLGGRPCLLVVTGMGRDRANKAAEFVLDRYPVTAVVCMGLAGALIPGLRTGDVVVCSRVIPGSGFDTNDGVAQAYAGDAHLLALASSGRAIKETLFSLGTNLTVPRLVSSPVTKKELRREFQADIVDMESYWIAERTAARRIPFIAIRSISDTLEEDLTPLDHILDSEGNVSWKEAMPYFLLHPQHLVTLVATLRNMRRAKQSLTGFISELVTRI